MMDGSAHLPGCDMRHTRRQRCSTWIAAEPANVEPSFVASDARGWGRRGWTRLAVGAFGVDVFVRAIFWIGIVIVTSTCNSRTEDCAWEIVLVAPIVVWIALEVAVYVPIQLVSLVMAATATDTSSPAQGESAGD
jgi:hypothetical protein